MAIAGGPPPAVPPARLEAVRAYASRIVGQQAADGAIVMGDPADPRVHVIPYFANLGVHGLLEAAAVIRDAAYTKAARRWLGWYESHMNPDGTVYDYVRDGAGWKATRDYDSTDSYAATYLEAVALAQRTAPDAAWLRDRIPYVRRAVAAIRLTMQPVGMTLAKPTYPVMYTMDNVEALSGLRAAAVIGKAAHEDDLARDAAGMADRMEAAIRDQMWDPDADAYIVGLQPDGYRHKGLAKWYPDIMANLMAVAWLPPSPRNEALYGRLLARFAPKEGGATKTDDALDVYLWWGMAAQAAGHRESAGRFSKVVETAAATVPSHLNPATAGHAIRILLGR